MQTQAPLARLAAIALALGVGCGGGGVQPAAPRSAKTDGKAAAPPPFVTPATLLALPERSQGPQETDPDGSRRLLVHGMRLLERLDGSLLRGPELMPGSRQVKSVELPERLGGGFVFSTTASGSTLLWRAKSWVGKLEPLANVDMDVDQIVAGFDRLYLLDRRSLDVVALDPVTGKATDGGSLPLAPAYDAMAFRDAWLGAVEVPLQGVLVSFDAGASWRPLGVYPTYGVALEHGEVVINTPSGRFALDDGGTLRHPSGGARSDAAFADAARDQPAPKVEDPTVTPPTPLGRRPLLTAVLHGFADTKDSAVAVHEGAIGRVRLSDGKLLDVKERALVSSAGCHAVRFGDGHGFVCGEERGRTSIHRFVPPLGLEPVITFDGPRYVGASESGALVVRGPCSSDARRVSGSYCIVSTKAAPRELRVKGDVGVERVVALADGRAAVIVPPRLGAPGLLSLVSASGSTTSRELKLPKTDASTRALLKKGLWLDGFVERRVGKKKETVLAGWVAAAGPFVGVRVALDGKVSVGKLENDIGQTLLSGSLALTLGRGGRAAETTDGGFFWREVELPAEGAAARVRTTRTELGGERGCSPVGCAFGSWLRVGWGGRGDASSLQVADPPKPTVLPSPAGGRWQLACAPTGKMHPGGTPPPRRTARPRPRRPWTGTPMVSPEEVEDGEWAPFMSAAPPRRGRDDVGLDFGIDQGAERIRAYAWGPRAASWERAGRWQARAFDELSFDDAIWSTAPTKSPWPDSVTAAQAFGADPSSPTSWTAELDPGGRAAAMLINARGTMELYLLEDGRSIAPVADASKQGLYQLSGAVKLGSTWYLGSAQGNNAFQLFRVEGSRVTRTRLYPLKFNARARGSIVTRLVRNARGDQLGIWVQARRMRGVASRWYVYPVDAETGDVGAPLELAPEDLAQVPRSCAHGEDGYVLVGEPPVDPYVDFTQGADALRQRRAIARMLAGSRGLCLDTLSAESEQPLPARPPRASIADFARGKETTPLVLHDRDRSGRRWEFRCVR